MLSDAFMGLARMPLRRKVRDDDGIDQLHHFITSSIFLIFGAIVGFKEYLGEPINCWNYNTSQFKHYQEHINFYCWSHSLYRYPNKTNLNITPYSLDTSSGLTLNAAQTAIQYKITFYRWITILCVIQAFLFKMPNLLWSEYNAYSGSNIVKMVEMLQDVSFAKEEDKKEKMFQVGLFLEQWLRIHRKTYWFLSSNLTPKAPQKFSWRNLFSGDSLSNKLSNLYLGVKAAFLFNVILQFFIVSGFLGLNYWSFGFLSAQSYCFTNLHKVTSLNFPVVALCHFQTYQEGRSTNLWVQCILNINLFLEKLFFIEWIWLIVLLILTALNFCFWCLKILQPKRAVKFVQRYMRIMGHYSKPARLLDIVSVDQFVNEYLRNDGVFILRILSVNTNEIVVAGLVEALWIRYIDMSTLKMGQFAENMQPIFQEVKNTQSATIITY